MVRMHRGPLTQFFGDVNRIQDEFTRLFGTTPVTGPAINIWADADQFHAETDLPGIDPATLEITVTDGTQLTIQGARTTTEPEGAVWLKQERPSGAFRREVSLPSLVDADRVEAKYEQGVLRLTLPKSEAAKPRKIVVKS